MAVGCTVGRAVGGVDGEAATQRQFPYTLRASRAKKIHQPVGRAEGGAVREAVIGAGTGYPVGRADGDVDGYPVGRADGDVAG